jgi:hypothetical protein
MYIAHSMYTNATQPSECVRKLMACICRCRDIFCIAYQAVTGSKVSSQKRRFRLVPLLDLMQAIFVAKGFVSDFWRANFAIARHVNADTLGVTRRSPFVAIVSASISTVNIQTRPHGGSHRWYHRRMYLYTRGPHCWKFSSRTWMA